MALTSGAHITCGFVIDRRGAKLFKPVWFETIALGGTTTQPAPKATDDLKAEDVSVLVLRVRAQSAGDIYVAAHASPDASQAVGSTAATVRQHLLASQEKDIPADAGWKCNVVAA